MGTLLDLDLFSLLPIFSNAQDGIIFIEREGDQLLDIHLFWGDERVSH